MKTQLTLTIKIILRRLSPGQGYYRFLYTLCLKTGKASPTNEKHRKSVTISNVTSETRGQKRVRGSKGTKPHDHPVCVYTLLTVYMNAL